MSAGRAEDEELWAAIAEPSRRQLLDQLLAAGEATASALADVLPLTRQAVAKHLAVLDRVGLVTCERVGREVRYTVQPARLDEATRSMARVAAQWDKRLQDIKSLAEGVPRQHDREG